MMILHAETVNTDWKHLLTTPSGFSVASKLHTSFFSQVGLIRKKCKVAKWQRSNGAKECAHVDVWTMQREDECKKVKHIYSRGQKKKKKKKKAKMFYAHHYGITARRAYRGGKAVVGLLPSPSSFFTFHLEIRNTR
ncbi:hypothetical protein POVWA1_002210 [Plasmodium ovale wallikeri]|uniref:Uncharacterized protein n=1 Tax=Plasmodium ovale wallikeri TaxID=864142 RepID=A0A1A8YG81_PLAOA|nr:hypothetical protein POVWA1_002210 [Plasmodium ovale wallikeri]